MIPVWFSTVCSKTVSSNVWHFGCFSHALTWLLGSFPQYFNGITWCCCRARRKKSRSRRQTPIWPDSGTWYCCKWLMWTECSASWMSWDDTTGTSRTLAPSVSVTQQHFSSLLNCYSFSYLRASYDERARSRYCFWWRLRVCMSARKKNWKIGLLGCVKLLSKKVRYNFATKIWWASQWTTVLRCVYTSVN